MLALGSALNGLLAYGVFATTTHSLGPAAAAPVAVLWSVWALCAAAVTFPVQHWIATLAGAAPDGLPGSFLRPVAAATGGVALLVTATTAALREPLFGTGSPWYPVLSGCLALGAGAVGAARGLLTVEGRFSVLAVSLVTENAARCSAVLAVTATGSTDPLAYGLCLLTGHLVAVAVPVRWRAGRARRRAGLGPWRFLAGAGSAQLLHQVVLTSGPLVAAPLGAAPTAVTGLFVASALFRAPFLVALGMAPRLTRTAARLVAAQDVAPLSRILVVTAATSAVVGVLAGLLAASIGPDLLQVLFGAQVSRLQAALLAAGSVLAVANLVTAVVALVFGRAGVGAGAWLGAVLAGASVLLVARPEDVADRVATAFLVAEATAWAMLLIGVVHVLRRPTAP